MFEQVQLLLVNLMIQNLKNLKSIKITIDSGRNNLIMTITHTLLDPIRLQP